MITFQPVIPYRRRDGTFSVLIRVTHRRASRRIMTPLVCKAADLSRAGKIKNVDLLRKLDGIIRDMRTAMDAVSPSELERLDIDGVVDIIRHGRKEQPFRLDFFQFAEGYIGGKTPGSRAAYRQALNALERFLGRRQLDMNEITRSLLLDFMAAIDGEKKVRFYKGEWKETEKAKIPRAASSRHLMKLSHIFAAARLRFNDEDTGTIHIPRSPFSGIQQYRPLSRGQRNLGRKLMQKIILSEPADRLQREALALFVVSFALMGANLADLWEAGMQDGRTWVYHRKKTRTRRPDGAEVVVEIPPEIGPFVSRLQDGRGRWWFPCLRRYGSSDSATASMNRSLAAWCGAEGVPVFTFGAARHSWASIARAEGIEKATVDDALGHRGQWDLTDIYAEKSWGLVAAASRKVVGLFSWPGVTE